MKWLLLGCAVFLGGCIGDDKVTVICNCCKGNLQIDADAVVELEEIPWEVQGASF